MIRKKYGLGYLTVIYKPPCTGSKEKFMQISVLVVTFNEEIRLKDCLLSLKRFDDVMVADLGSNDSSAKIAQNLGFKVVACPWVPIVEMVLPTLIPAMKYDWVIHVDPDEVLPPELIDDLFQLEVDDKYGIIDVPYQYYFLNKKLDTTIWGGVRPLPRVINRTRVNVTPEVHRALRCKPGYETFTLPYRPGNAVLHYWIDSYEQVFSKHERYVVMEGESRYKNGFRFNWKSLIMSPLRGFKDSFIRCSGWRGGWHGWFLSAFFAFYEMRALLSLYRYEKNMKRGSS
jgi:glycosyltransferase involved in cell wall biosynthesis